MYNYIIEFPLTNKSIPKIEEALNIEFKGKLDSDNSFSLESFIHDDNQNIYYIEIYDLFYYNDLPNDDPDSIGALKFNELNISFIKNIMTKICDSIKQFKPFQNYTIGRFFIYNNLTNHTSPL